jgi:thiol-disulfide isomerase/thioredoxin
VILLDFWATWCGPCKVEIPGFVEMQNTYGPKGFQVIGISIDDKADQLKPFAAEYKMNYPVLQGLGRDDVTDALGPILGLPTTLIIGRDGRICAAHAGMTSKETFENQIKELL